MKKKITELKDIEVSSIENTDKELIINLKDGEKLEFYADGDCCSKSFIEDLDNPECLVECKLLSVEAVDGKQEDNHDYIVSKWTFYKFKTDKGMCTLSFRNDSNGYYNGSLEPA